MTPWELAAKTEHSQQRALFAWANCAAEFGFYLAQYGDCYSKDKRERWFKFAGYNIDKPPTEPVPELALLFAIHNQGHGDRIRGAQAKAEGVKAGVPDMMLPIPRPLPHPFTGLFHGLFIELKTITKGNYGDIQKQWGNDLMRQGYHVMLCRGWIEAANTIAGYLGSMVRIDDAPN